MGAFNNKGDPFTGTCHPWTHPAAIATVLVAVGGGGWRAAKSAPRAIWAGTAIVDVVRNARGVYAFL